MDVIETVFTENKPSSEEEMQSIVMKIIEEIMKELTKLKKSFKYAVTVLLGQKFGTALNHYSIIV